MKKPSDTKPSLSLRDLTFFTDRDLGKLVPRILRENDLVVEPYFDHFPERVKVPDNEWLALVAEKGWVALSHDDNIRRDREAVRTIMEHKGRLFILRGSVTSRELASLFLEAAESVLDILEKNLHQAFIANVRRSAHQGGIVQSGAHLMLTFEDWARSRL